MSDETKIFTKNDKNGDKCASGGQESGLKLIFERGVAILVRPWRFPGQPKKFVFFSIKVGTINSGTSLDSREQFKKTGKLEYWNSLKDNFNGLRSTSYTWGRAEWKWNGHGMSQFPTVLKIGSVRKPSKYYLIADRGADQTNPGKALSALSHNLSYNVSFLDGHVAGYRFSGVSWRSRNDY